MSKTYKIQEEETIVHVSRREVLDSRICDICGKRAIDDVYWDINVYQSNSTTVELVNFVDDAGSLTYWFDICPECFVGKFIDMMKREFGAEVNIE